MSCKIKLEKLVKRPLLKVVLFLVILFSTICIPTARVQAEESTGYLLDRVITWSDGSTEHVQIDNSGFILLNGLRRRLVGMSISNNWPYSSGGDVSGQFYLPQNLALLDKELTYLQSVGIRLVRLDLGYVRFYGLTLAQESQAWASILNVIYNHKMLVIPQLNARYLPNFDSLANPNFSWYAGWNQYDSMAEWVARWSAVVSDYPNVIAVAAENELDVKYPSEDTGTEYQNYTAAEVTNYLTFLIDNLHSGGINVPIIHNIVANYVEPTIKQACLNAVDIPSSYCYSATTNTLQTRLDNFLPWLGIEPGWWCSELNQGEGQIVDGNWQNVIDVTKFNAGYIDTVFYEGAAIAMLYCGSDAVYPNKAFFDVSGNPKPQLLEVASQISRLQDPSNAAIPPHVTTVTADNLTINSARLNGNLTSQGESTSCSVSFLWGPTSDNLTHETTPQTMSTTGVFSDNITGLNPATTYYFKAKAVGASTVFGAETSFVSKTAYPPAVVTIAADSVTNNSARLRGSLSYMGTSTSCTVSFLWGPTADNLIYETTPQTMTATGYYYANLSGLSPGTRYYFKAKAVGTGTRLGSQLSFLTTGTPSPPTVATVAADYITTNSARLNGNLTSLGANTSCTVSFLWGTTSGNLTNETTPQTITAAGYYSTTISGLTTGTRYYFKAKAIGASTTFGDQTSFVTWTREYPPAVATVTADTIKNNSARLRGNLTSLGTNTSCTVSFLWGTTSGNLTNETTPQIMTSTGSFSANLSGLTPGTRYYFKAKAIGRSTVFGNQASFVTTGSAAPPIVATVAADYITTNSARLNGNLTNLGTSTSCTVSFLWGPTSDSLTNETMPQTMPNTGYYNATISGLTPGAMYYFKAKAIGISTTFGDQTSFITWTREYPPAVATVTADTITSNSARLRGNLTSLGTNTSCSVSFLWGPTSDNLTRETTPQIMTSTGLFSDNITGLTPATTYYFKAKAVGNSTRIGVQASFITRP